MLSFDFIVVDANGLPVGTFAWCRIVSDVATLVASVTGHLPYLFLLLVVFSHQTYLLTCRISTSLCRVILLDHLVLAMAPGRALYTTLTILRINSRFPIIVVIYLLYVFHIAYSTICSVMLYESVGTVLVVLLLYATHRRSCGGGVLLEPHLVILKVASVVRWVTFSFSIILCLVMIQNIMWMNIISATISLPTGIPRIIFLPHSTSLTSWWIIIRISPLILWLGWVICTIHINPPTTNTSWRPPQRLI